MTEADRMKEEVESGEHEFRAREFLGRDEQYARRDPELQLLMFPESPKDIAKATEEILKSYTNFDEAEGNSPYKMQYYMQAASDSAFIFGHTIEDLQNEGYVKGKIGPDGYLEKKGKPIKFGYAIKVHSDQQREDVINLREEQLLGSDGIPSGIKKIKTYAPTTFIEERFDYGTNKMRKALHEASRASYREMVNTVRVHELYSILDNQRADLSGMVTILYLKAKHISNEQMQEIFTAPDIGLITKENPTNEKKGYRRDRAMRMLDLLGNCETKEKMKDFMNRPTFEKILDKKTIANALELMKKTGYEDKEAQSDKEKVARFLVGKAVVYKDGKWELQGWATKDQRDPSKATSEDDKKKRGFYTIEEEKKLRGLLTEYGNPYARGSRDEMSMLLSRITLLVGDEGAVKDADRFFQIFGLKDEMGMEKLAKMPTTEEILNAQKLDYEEWRKKADEWLTWFSLPGEPIGSDLSKIMWSKYYRLKDILRDRPSGPTLTVNNYVRLTQSLFSLARNKIKVQIGSEKEKQIRSVLEQWRGYAAEENMPREEAIDLGKIDWQAVQVPSDLKDAVGKEALGIRSGAVPDGAWTYYTLMNWLAGRDNVIKAPWLFILDELEDPRLLRKAKFYTNKQKFLSIIWHKEALALGEWRKLYKENNNDQDEVDKHLEKLEKDSITSGKKQYWKGVRSLPDFPEIMATMVRVMRPHKAGGVMDTFEHPLMMVVEGTEGKPGLAVKYGFLDRSELANDFSRFLSEQKIR